MRKWIRFGAAVLALAVAAACLVWVRLAQTPLPRTDLTPASHPEAWRFSLGDGTPLTPGPDGGLDVPAGETVYCVTTLPELDVLAPLEIGTGGVEAALLLDETPVADPSGRFTVGEGFSKPAPERSSSVGRFDLVNAAGRELTLAVQFLEESANLSAIPSVTLYPETLVYDSQSYTQAASAALPAGVFLTVGLLLIALSLFQFWWGRRDWDMVFLATASLAFALGESFRYSHYVLGVLKLVSLMIFVNGLPILAVLWLLWQHTTGPRKRWGLLGPGLVTGAFLLALAGVIPLTWWTPLATALNSLAWGSFFLLTELLCRPLLLAALLSAVIDWLHAEVFRRAEERLLAQRGELAQSSYEAMRRQHEQVMMLRHDMVKHFQVLRQTVTDEKAAAYLDELIGENEKIRPVVQSGNEMLDVILNGKLSTAADAGIAVELVRTQAPNKLPLTDAELCSLTLNLLDNALEAASAPGVKRRYIKLDMHTQNNYFVFTCENGATLNWINKETAPEHGLGLKVVRQIVERYGNLFNTEYGDGYYRVTVPLSLRQPRK